MLALLPSPSHLLLQPLPPRLLLPLRLDLLMRLLLPLLQHPLMRTGQPPSSTA